MERFVCGNYEVMKLLGEGTYGKVYLVEKDSKKFALKQFQQDLFVKGEGVPESIVVELDILNRVNHPNVLAATETFIDPKGKTCLILELASSETPDLAAYIASIRNTLDVGNPPIETLPMMFQMLCGLHYLHENFIMHRDIKLENVLIFRSGSTPICKLADFGLACVFYEPEPLNYFGEILTPTYRAPELLIYDIKGVKGSNRPYDKGVDIWALGLTFFEFITGEFISNVLYNQNPKYSEQDVLKYIEDIFGPLTSEQFSILTKISRDHSLSKMHKMRLNGVVNPIFKDMKKGYADFILKMMICDPFKRPDTKSLLKDKLFSKLKCHTTNIEYAPAKLEYKGDFTPEKRRLALENVKLPPLDKFFEPMRFHIKFLAIDIFDRYVSAQTKYTITDTFLTQAIYASVHMAAKVYYHFFDYLDAVSLPIQPPPWYLSFFNYGPVDIFSQLDEMEYDMLKTLKFRMFRPTLDILFKGVNVKKLQECYLTSFVPDEIYACAK